MGVGYKIKHLRFEVQQIDAAEPTKETFGTSPIHNVGTSHPKFGSKRKSSTPLGPCKNLKMQKKRETNNRPRLCFYSFQVKMQHISATKRHSPHIHVSKAEDPYNHKA